MIHRRTSPRCASALASLALSAVLLQAQPAGQPYISTEGRYAAKFPGAPKVTNQTARSALGDLKINVATYAASDANVYLVSYTDFPVAAAKDENRKTLFDGVRDALKAKGTVSEKEIEFGPDKLPGREVTVDRDKDKQRIKVRAVLRDNRLYQVAVIGTAEFVGGKEATAFLDSLDLTK
ncbi:hypothetical protein GobsT_00650 [Gemmata obscuriglobus]|uniref:DUF4252 domain-containing protein n=1 Tax=Gemmata obscuriglobus TaxID=114 RepID=A0A2Z3HIL1_9BACT|nr:hypothetical protein [Gemmata obscuriglobus]AWM41310.1 hypothetical protein C1280_32815 [Gemmata obscuriglobus]QEG25340.1 hypothetical protein GobsT_00650 [Gemmata obscuriglobus]VTR98282.1 Putative lipoprotein OS=Leptolyngbya sp. PCC 7376 GN=Lepto7376_1412 PE=4 SV=1 [Gemmata obscuriglobus UQM 2246]